MAVYKVNVSLPRDLVCEIDRTAQGLGMSRSGFVAEATARYVADITNLSAEEQRQKDIDRAVQMFRRIGREIPESFDFLANLRADRERDGRDSAR